MFQTTVVERIKTHILYSVMEQKFRADQTTDNNITQHVCISCWISKATNAQPEYVILIAFLL